MRVISQYGKYRIQLRPIRVKGLGDGTAETLQEPVYCQFSNDEIIYENELAEAKRFLSFPGLMQERDEATPLEPIYRMSVFDTAKQGYDEEMRAFVEEGFREQKRLGNVEFIIVESTPIPRPWPNYDRIKDPKKIALKVQEDGFEVQSVIDYERLFGQNRADVIEALEALEVDEVVVTA
jgi:hypothetical protein